MSNADWSSQNQHHLVAALERVSGNLKAYIDGAAQPAPAAQRPGESAAEDAGADDLFALDMLRLSFGLSAFENDLLLLCAGVELDANFARLVAQAHGGERPGPGAPTFSLALAALPHAHWSALSPDGPLRRWRFIEIGAGESLMTSPLRIDEWALHYLTGVNYIDERLQMLVEPAPAAVSDDTEISMLPDSQRELANQAAQSWTEDGRRANGSGALIQLVGSDPASQVRVAAEICAILGMRLYTLRAVDIPSGAGERAILARLWEREAALKFLALLLDCRAETAPGSAENSAANANALALAERLQAHVMVMVAPQEGAHDAAPGDSTRAAQSPEQTGELGQRPVLRLEIAKPQPQEQKMLWQAALGEDAAQLNGAVDGLVEQFNLSAGEIQRASATAKQSATHSTSLEHALWLACRAQSRPRLEGLAERIEPAASWDDLVLPQAQLQLLKSMAAHVRNRATVYNRWGFAARSARGLGISALFAGVSGTGKTMAAEVLANDLRLDLYRIDLSAVVSKYIGETEKNLRQVFDIAEGGGAILLFDEADALFGKRSEVQDSHDRYANIEVSYLLQRMEAYRGLAILTTNMKSALDTAFLRRIRFIVNFPFPDQEQRTEIWRRIFPALTPLRDLDVDKLSRLAITGGHIRNIALHAAFLAADESGSVGMAHLLQAARSEYAKLEKTLSENEVREWI